MERLTAYRPPLPREKALQPEQPTRTGRCPFLGTEADPGTALAFPSDANHCFRTRLPVPVSLIHQETYCLSTRYTSCPVYRQNVLISPDLAIGPTAAAMSGSGPLGGPPGGTMIGTMAGTMNGGMTETMMGETAAAAPAPRKRQAFNFTSLLILVVMLGLAFLAWQSWRGYLADPTSEVQPTVGVEQIDPPVVPSVLPPTPLVTGEVASGAGEVGEASATPTPSPIATSSTDKSPDLLSGLLGEATPTASTPNSSDASATPETECGPPQWWVRVVVEVGDTAESLAEARGITAAELLHANCLDAATSLTPGRAIFLPPLGVIVTLQPPATLPAPASGGNTGQPFPTVFLPSPFPTLTSTPLPPDPTNTPESQPPDTPPPTVTPPPTGISPTIPPPATITPLPTSTPPRQPTLPPTSTPPPDVGPTNTPQPTPTATVVPTKTPPGSL